MNTSAPKDAVRAAQFVNHEGVPPFTLGAPGIPAPSTKTPAGGEINININQNTPLKAQKAEKANWFSPYWSLLTSTPVFRVLCAQYSVSISGDALNMMATLFMLQRETSSSLALSGLLATRQLPYIIFAPVAGWLSDRFQRLHVMAVCDALRMFVVLLYLISSRGGSLWLLFALGFVQHSLSTLSDPAFHALVPQYVPPESLQYAHTIMTTLWAIVVTIAYAVGGTLVAVAGPVPNIIGDSLCYALSLGLIGYLMYHTSTLPRFITPKPFVSDDYATEEEATTHSTSSEGEVGIEGHLEEVTVDDEATDADQVASSEDSDQVESSEDPGECREAAENAKPLASDDQKRQGLLASFIEAIKYIIREHYVIALSSIRLLDALGYGAVSLIAIKLAEEELHIARSVPITLGVMYVALGIAAFLGPFLAHMLVRSSLERTHAFFVMCTILEASAMALICWSPHVSVLIIATALHMAAMSSNHVSATALIQRLVPAQLYARINALDTCASAVLELIALFVTGALMDDLRWGSRTVMLVFALIATASTLIVHILFSMAFTPHHVHRKYGVSLLLKVGDEDF